MDDQVRHRNRGECGARPVRLWILVLTVVTTGIAACGTSRPPPVASPPSRPAQLLATETISPWVRDVVIDSPALDRYAMVRLLLPRRFSAEPDRRWPVLWLLHGC